MWCGRRARRTRSLDCPCEGHHLSTSRFSEVLVSYGDVLVSARRLHRSQQRMFRVEAWRDSRPDRPEPASARARSSIFVVTLLIPTQGSIEIRRRPRSLASHPTASSPRIGRHLPYSAPFLADDFRERGAGRLITVRAATASPRPMSRRNALQCRACRPRPMPRRWPRRPPA